MSALAAPNMVRVSLAPDPDWYFEQVLASGHPADSVGALTDGLPAAQWMAWWRSACRERSPLIDLARSQGWVLTRRQLLEIGLADHDVRRCVRRGIWSTPRYGVVSPIVAGGDPRRGHALASTAAALVRPDHVVSGRSAAVLRGLPTMRVPSTPELTRSASTTGHRAGAHVFGATLGASDVGEWFGAPVTTVARTLVDLGRHDAWDAIMAADAARRERLVTAAQVRAALEQAAGWPGVRQAREVLACASPKAESPLESLTRWRLRESAFPEPELQFGIAGYFADLCWPQIRLVLECDGRGKYSADALWREKRREAVLRRHGYQVDRVIWADVTRDWPAVCSRLALHFPAEIATFGGQK